MLSVELCGKVAIAEREKVSACIEKSSFFPWSGENSSLNQIATEAVKWSFKSL